MVAFTKIAASKLALFALLALLSLAAVPRLHSEEAAAPAPAPAAAAEKPAEVKPAPAPPPAPAAEKALPPPPPGGRLIILDGKPVYVDDHLNVIVSAGADGKGGADASADEKLKAIREAAARLREEDQIRVAIRRLSTSGWRDAKADLMRYGKVAIPFLIEAMSNQEPDGSAAPGTYQLGGQLKADAGHATRQRTRGDVCADLLTEIFTNHSNYKGELPTLKQEDWQAWWTANADKININVGG